jgi:hypothetical protein
MIKSIGEANHNLVWRTASSRVAGFHLLDRYRS